MSKGSEVRPKQISDKEYSDNWDRIFAKKKKPKVKRKPKPKPVKRGY